MTVRRPPARVHGSATGYRQHKKYGEPPCQPCWDANKADRADRARRFAPRTPDSPIRRDAATPGGWALQGACTTTDPEVFFPDKGESSRAAKRVCSGCPVIAECREWALDTGQEFGVWGGLSATDRVRILGRGRKAA